MPGTTTYSSFGVAVVIRTLPNDESKRTKQHKNSPYFTPDAINYIINQFPRIQHLLVDLPSLDREQDNGTLLSHCAFWEFDKNNQQSKTKLSEKLITELCYIPNEIVDGYYFLDLHLTPLHMDAVPSRPLLYPIIYSKK